MSKEFYFCISRFNFSLFLDILIICFCVKHCSLVSHENANYLRSGVAETDAASGWLVQVLSRLQRAWCAARILEAAVFEEW